MCSQQRSWSRASTAGLKASPTLSRCNIPSTTSRQVRAPVTGGAFASLLLLLPALFSLHCAPMLLPTSISTLSAPSLPQHFPFFPLPDPMCKCLPISPFPSSVSALQGANYLRRPSLRLYKPCVADGGDSTGHFPTGCKTLGSSLRHLAHVQCLTPMRCFSLCHQIK